MPDLSWPLLDIGSVVVAHSAGIVGRLLMAWHHHIEPPSSSPVSIHGHIAHP